MSRVSEWFEEGDLGPREHLQGLGIYLRSAKGRVRAGVMGIGRVPLSRNPSQTECAECAD